MKALGICVGASTISMAGLERNGSGAIATLDVRVEPHHGNPRRYLLEMLNDIDASRYDRVSVTGRRFRQFLNLSSIPEPQAVEQALAHLNGRGENLEAVVSAGGETFLVYALDRDGRISTVHTGNKCASGTGEFFLQQIKRLGMDVGEATGLARSQSPYRVSGRCSVFCKSDCTHAANKGVPKGRIVAGLCQMMAGKIVEILHQVPRRDIMVIGGTARNDVVMDHLRQEIKNLQVPDEAPYFEALGAALWALENETAPFPGTGKLFRDEESSFTTLQPLDDFRDRVEFKPARRGEAGAGERLILGLDVGSTTTKAVLMRDIDHAIVASVYLRTDGDPVRASRECYRALIDQLGPLAEQVQIEGLGVTGSGRQIAGLHAMTEGIINEIAAHAAAAVFFDPDVDTIFEIGGQDAKYTYITHGVPSDYAMNEACSAGTGSFLEEAARESLNIGMEEIAGIALAGRRPPNFNDQCAAFINSDIKRAFHEGISREDVVAGLVYSICMNYHKRVKGNRAVGRKVFLQGGVCYNRAVPLAMAAVTGRHIIVPPDPGLTGAFGVALEIRRRLELGLMRRQSFSLAALRDRDLAVRLSLHLQRRRRPVRPPLRDRAHPHRREDLPLRRGLQPLVQSAAGPQGGPRGSRPRSPVGATRLRQGGRGDGPARRCRRPEQVLLYRHVLSPVQAVLRGAGLCRRPARNDPAGGRGPQGRGLLLPRGDLPRLPRGSAGEEDRLALPAALQGDRAAKRQRAGPGQEHYLPALAGRALLPGHGLQGPPGLSGSEKSRSHPVSRHRFLERA